LSSGKESEQAGWEHVGFTQASAASNCGGNGNCGKISPTAEPTAKTLAESPTAEPTAKTTAEATGQAIASKVTVVSYNLYWWNVKSSNRWSQLYDRIKKHKPFDLIGFQECEDVADVVRDAGLDNFDYYQGPNKPSNNPAPIAWNRDVFTKLDGPGNRWVASDRYGGRYMTWVRLQHKASGVNILFANTHGPLGNCGSTLGNNWKKGVSDKRDTDDIVFFTGDFNCWTGTSAMSILKRSLYDDGVNDVDGGIDQILTDRGQLEAGGKEEGWPSDHPLIKGTFYISGGSQGGDLYRWVGAPKVGGWGGKCRCPESGIEYEVGDNYDSCASLACEGGEVVQPCGEDVISSSRGGWMVTCAGPTPPPTPKPTSTPTLRPAPTVQAPEDVYMYVGAPKVGGWGGKCKCPGSGVVYEVGDNYDSCASLACIGGEVVQPCGEGIISSDRAGWMVTCDGTTSAPGSTSGSCVAFDQWPDVDGGITCGSCTALVLTEPYGGSCKEYCQSFGHTCAAAAEEEAENCEIKYTSSCDEVIAGTSDMLCTCHRKGGLLLQS
jgi:hypothetical protein